MPQAQVSLSNKAVYFRQIGTLPGDTGRMGDCFTPLWSARVIPTGVKPQHLYAKCSFLKTGQAAKAAI